MRYLWIILGGTSVTLGALGAILPLLPTTPFLLLAAWCFAKASPRLHLWLVTHRRFGPPIEDWRTHGAIRPRAKAVAMSAIGLSFVTGLGLGLSGTILTIQAAVLCAVSLFILTRPGGSRA